MFNKSHVKVECSIICLGTMLNVYVPIKGAEIKFKPELVLPPSSIAKINQ